LSAIITTERDGYFGFAEVIFPASLSENFPNDASRLDTGQALIQALVREAQLLVVDAQLVQHGRMQITDGYRIANDVVAEIVCLTIRHPALDAAAGHPCGKAAGMVVAAVIVAFQFALAINGAAEFAGKDDDRFVQQPVLLQVPQKRSGRLVDVKALPPQLLRQNGVVIPAAVEDLDESHAAFDHPPGEQAVAGKGPVLVDFRSV
jgi:hypothetical protein